MLYARSSPECHLYMRLHPCVCGEARLAGEHRVELRGGNLVAVYDGPCARCGAPRDFAFVLDPEIPPGGAYGGAGRSAIIDPGEFIAVADEAARRNDLDGAIAALEEVLKFVPDGADRVPVEAFRRDGGLAAYEAEPGRFRRIRLEAVLATYRELRARAR